MPFLASRNQIFYYEDTGGELPVVVFSHGFLSDHELFAPQVHALRYRFRCITWDQRYHGQTSTDNCPFTIEDSVEDLHSLLEHLAIERAALVGFSFGAWVSNRFALAYPDQVAALVIIDSYERMESEEERSNYLGFKAMMTSQGFDEELSSLLLGFLFGADFDASHWVAKWRFRPPQQWAHVYDAMLSRNDICDQLKEIRCPSIVLHSECNPANPPEVSAQLCRSLGSCQRMVVIEGSGHTAPLEKPDQVNIELIDFLNQNFQPLKLGSDE